MRKIFFIIFSFFILLTPTKILADENFDVSYDLFYRFQEGEITSVTQTTTLTNKQTNLYATEYEITIFGQLVGEVSGFDGQGKLPITTAKEGGSKTKIHLKFNQKSVGVGSKLNFSLNYQLSGLVNKIGRIREVSVPKLGENPQPTSYNLKISVPKKYGQLGFVKPKKNFEETSDSYIFTFGYQEAKEGVLIGFGDFANFKFRLTYHLKNSSLIARKMEIVLPSDTLFQQVIYQSITPSPSEVNLDKDGNWLASFELSPKQEMDVEASGNVLIYTTAREDFSQTAPDNQHLSSHKYWESNSQEIKEISANLDTPQKIYDFVVKTLRYDYSRVNTENPRQGAKAVLSSPQSAICMEFTDLFIALCRASGIPAREVNGFAYTLDEYLKPLSLVADILHAWPEYWDYQRKAWIPVDPTWANTSGLDYFNSLDFNHFAFVRRGISSIYPIAAGSYREKNQGKDIEVTPETIAPEIPPTKIELIVTAPKKILSGRKENLLLTVYNNGGIAKYNLPVEVSGSGLTFEIEEEKISLPPFGKRELMVKILADKKFWGIIPVKFTVSGVSREINIEIQPIELLYFPLIVIIFITLLFLLIILLIRKKRRAK